MKVLSDRPCSLGEGPTYDAGSDTAWWFDILARRLFETRPGVGERLSDSSQRSLDRRVVATTRGCS